jgi:hypothetical protein
MTAEELVCGRPLAGPANVLLVRQVRAMPIAQASLSSRQPDERIPGKRTRSSSARDRRPMCSLSSSASIARSCSTREMRGATGASASAIEEQLDGRLARERQEHLDAVDADQDVSDELAGQRAADLGGRQRTDRRVVVVGTRHGSADLPRVARRRVRDKVREALPIETKWRHGLGFCRRGREAHPDTYSGISGSRRRTVAGWSLVSAEVNAL